MRNIKNSKGFTLLELLISAAISIVVVGAALSVYLAQHKHMIVQDQISDMQLNVRAGMQELSTKIRMAGYNVPTGLDAIQAYNTNPDSIVVMYDTELLEGVTINHAMPQPSAELRCDGDISPLQDDQWAYIYNPTTQSGEFFLITHVQVAAGHIQHNTMPLSTTYPVGSIIMAMEASKYFVDATTDPDHPRLMVQNFSDTPQIYSDNITDLQFQYVLSSGATVDVPPMSSMIREVVINMDARTERTDEVLDGDGYRTRTLQTKVMVRNLGIN
ncbi:MAG: hypothetical protein GY839_14320 [candidate division Zixibacteria bacterium]|nr:hypothetical protein [candidate division Zixibacteria bacterium]